MNYTGTACKAARFLLGTAPKMGKRKRSALARPLPMGFYGFFISLKIWKVPRAAVPDFARAPRKAIENTLPGQGLLRIAVSFCKGPGQRCLLCFPIGAAKSGQNKKAQRAVCPRDFAVSLPGIQSLTRGFCPARGFSPPMPHGRFGDSPGKQRAKNWQNKKAQRAVCPVYISRFLSRAHKA